MKSTSTLLLLRQSSPLHPSSLTLLPKPPTAHIILPLKPTNPSRTFVSNPLTPLQTLTATRILPYHAPPLYNLIADIAAYPSFIPYCTSSTITSHSSPDATHGKKWPRTADLRVGYGPYDELFRSAVYCLPYSVLEAVAGDAEPTIPKSQLPHYYKRDGENQHNDDADGEKSAENHSSILTSLLTRWTFKEFPFKPPPPDGTTPQEGSASAPSRPRTEVGLVLEVRFASAVYSALSQAAAPKVAGMMIEAFEKRAAVVLGEGQGHGPESRAEEDGDRRSAMEGVSRG